jgi:hypothetical protein
LLEIDSDIEPRAPARVRVTLSKGHAGGYAEKLVVLRTADVDEGDAIAARNIRITPHHRSRLEGRATRRQGPVSLDVGDFIWTGGDCHLYLNYLAQADEQFSRKPQLKIARKPESIFDYRFDDFEILNYQHHAHIKVPVAV